MTGWTVVLSGIRYRPGRSLVVLILASVATLATVLAPAYSRAAQQSVLLDTLAAAAPSATGIQLHTTPSSAVDSAGLAKTARRVLERNPTLAARLDQPVAAADLETVVAAGDAVVAVARLSYRDSYCANLLLVSGACPAHDDEVLLSQRSAVEYHLTIGDRLTLRERAKSGAATGEPRTVKVAGLYRPVDAKDPYWGRGGYFAAGAPDGEASLPRLDTLFVADPAAVALPAATALLTLDYRLKAGSVRLDDVGSLLSDIDAFTTQVNAAQLQLSTGLPGVLDDANTEAAALAKSVPIIAVPLLLVCWFILFLLVSALADERSPEVALAKLRGFSASRSGGFGRAEAMLLVVVAAPLGAAAALGVVEILCMTVLRHPSLGAGPRVELRWPLAVYALVALAAALAIVWLASSRALSRPVLTLLRRVPRRSRRHLGVGEGLVVALAAASLVAAMTNENSPVALLAPALLALLAGVVISHLVSLWSRRQAGRSARHGRLAGVLAHAQLSRRRAGHWVMHVLTVAIGLLVFAATAWDVAATARTAVAIDTVGADRVLQVEAADPAALEAAVAAAVGPDGQDQVLPVVRSSVPYHDQTVELIGVPANRLAGVALWPGRGSAEVAGLGAKLSPDSIAPLSISGTVRVAATATDLVGAPRLGLLVAAADAPARVINLGSLSLGEHEYRAPLAGCVSSCRLLGVAITRAGAGTDQLSGTLTIGAISCDSGLVVADFSDHWRVGKGRSPQATVALSPGAELSVTFATTSPSDLLVEYADAPTSIPAALAGSSPADDEHADVFTFPAFGEQPQRFTVVERVSRIPRVGRRAILFDLDYAIRAAQRGSGLVDNTRLRYEVWASAAAPADLTARLAAAGLSILGEKSIAGETDRLSHGASTLGLRLYLLAAALALLLAIGSVLLTAYLGAAARRYEMAALRVVGVTTATLRRGLTWEYAYLLGLPLLVGTAAGLIGAAVMLPRIPLVAVGTVIEKITYTPGAGALPAALAGAALGMSLAALAVLRLVRGATPDRLRDGGMG